MKKLVLVLSLIAVALLSNGGICFANVPPDPGEPPFTTHTVTVLQDGPIQGAVAPIEGAVVAVYYSPTYQITPIFTGYTNNNGQVQFNAPDVCLYYRVTATPYAPATEISANNHVTISVPPCVTWNNHEATVLDTYSNEPIQGAFVSVYLYIGIGLPGGIFNWVPIFYCTNYTNSDGKVSFSAGGQAELYYTVTKPGYQQATVQSTEDEVTIYLTPLAGPVTIKPVNK